MTHTRGNLGLSRARATLQLTGSLCFIVCGPLNAEDLGGAARHAGVIGVRSISLKGSLGWADGSRSRNSAIDFEDNTTAGITFNTPVPWTDALLLPVSHDLFLAGQWGSIAGTQHDGGFSTGRQFRFDEQTFEIGTTIYPMRQTRFRPFVQIGYRNRSGTEPDTNPAIISDPRRGIFAQPVYADRNFSAHSLLLRPGLEYDLTNSLALRAEVDFDADGGIDNSILSGTIIHWINPQFFLQGGFVENLGLSSFAITGRIGTRF